MGILPAMNETPKLNVAHNAPITFAADGQTITGVVVTSKKSATTAEVTVRIQAAIKPGALLTIPGLAVGGCGPANPIPAGNSFMVKLSIAYNGIELATVGT